MMFDAFPISWLLRFVTMTNKPPIRPQPIAHQQPSRPRTTGGPASKVHDTILQLLCVLFCFVACGEMMMMEYAQVGIPLHRLRAASASASKAKAAEKFIQLVSVDKHEFWFMGFVNYDSAVTHLQEALSGFHHLRAWA
jgi:hypothetical protein